MPGRFLLALGIVVLSFGWTGNRSAYATCGDYLHQGPHAYVGSSGPGMTTEVSDLQHLPLEVPVRPCSGPSCSGMPTGPVSVPPVPVELSRMGDPAILWDLRANTGEFSRGAWILESDAGAFYEPLSIFRPPAV